MNILLIYPQMPDTFYAMKHFIKVIGKKAAYPPLGLLTVASLLPQEWQKKLVDLNLSDLEQEDLKWADFVFLSAMNVQEESVREIIQKCNEAKVKIIAGGPLFTHEYNRFPSIDHFVLNEAEITLPLFLEDLLKGKPKSVYETKEFADVTQSPLPAYELADMDEYIYSIIQFSRGCPYMCDFCDVTALFGRRPRVKNSVQIIRELEYLDQQSDVRLVLFADDNLIGNKRILKSDLLPALINWRKKKKPGFFFATQLTINLADDDELMKLMIDAGFRHIFIGIETPDENGLKESRKNQNLRRNQLENILKLHQAGFIISGGFIVGFDTDTPSIFEQQKEFIQQSGIPLPIVNIMKAPPGTELFDRIKREGRLSKEFAFTEGETNIVPMMDEKILYDGFIELITQIYLPEKSYERLIQFFNTYKFPKTSIKIASKYGINDIKMVMRIFYLLGIKDQNRKYFWKLIIWALVNNHKFLDKALFYGIMVFQMNQTFLHIKETVEDQNQHILLKKESNIA
ncbi:B12-binding domain-containing radical SAM protein [Chondrinema litorale]|uniref:B12-binding domain-containing radical SAM protein n=1 Tax=Chondrinema litorale TaxID=2994555 RepID=UPI002542ECF6|nr:radical SAM protein [Chondrinema litorale]UZR95981.1 radical SAM protein [Chondrinema litorale]